mmetsp:Transcript_20487/g.36800  ORF Transcript_20487/g.36800 Transcript_20487/m.36800 type:complete len:877 (-) Transcript_20487:159-2789(-)
MVLVTIGVVATAGALVGLRRVNASDVSDVLGKVVGKKQARRRVQTDDGSDIALVDTDAPEVRCFAQGRSRNGELRRLGLFKDELLLAEQPGPPAESLLLGGAEVSCQGAVIILELLDAPALTLWLESSEEAEYWAEVLGFASQVVVNEAPPLSLADGELVVPNSKIQELENRVSAALRAAYDRSARIKELEDTVEAGKSREERIQQLEDVLHETLEEAEARAEKIEALEWQLQNGGGTADPAARAILDDAMSFADQLLANNEDLVMDEGSAQELREAVQAVQEAKPAVDAETAELIRKLVTALRWPMVLRERLADAEEIAREQEEIQEQALHEIIELQKKNDDVEAALKERKAADEAAAKQRTLADEAHAETLRKLKERQDAAEAKSQEAELKAKELRELLDFADKAAEEAVEQKKAELEQKHEEELQKLRHLTDLAESQRKDAQAKAQELHDKLEASEKAIRDKAAKEQEELSAKHTDEVESLRREFAIAEEQRDQAEQQVLALKRQMEDSKAIEDEELAKLRATVEETQKTTTAQLEARDLQEDAIRKELEELKRSREAEDRRRAEADKELDELRTALASSQKKTDDAVASASQALEAQHTEEVKTLKRRVESVEVQQQIAESKAQELKNRLRSEAQAADEAQARQRKMSDSAQKKQLEDFQQKQRDAEAKQKAADAKAADLGRKLAAAEKAALQATEKQRLELAAEREEEMKNLTLQKQAAEEQLRKVESTASSLRERLAAAEVSMDQEAQRQREMVDLEQQKSFGPPQAGQHAQAPTDSGAGDAARWKMAADSAFATLSQSDKVDFKPTYVQSPSGFLDKKKELEQRLLNAEKTLKHLQEAPAGERPEEFGRAGSANHLRQTTPRRKPRRST